MKNLNKLTKAEIINKFRKLENNNSNKPNKSIFTSILETILQFKSFLLKITFITVLIKTLKRYSFFQRILRFTNWVILSIFGISLVDNFGFDFITHFFDEFRLVLSAIALYLTNTQFYSFVASIFTTKEDIPSSTKIKLNTKSSGIEQTIGQSERDSKILKWLKPEEEIQEHSNKKYYFIAGMLIIACLSWYYRDGIIDGLNWFRRGNAGNRDNGGGNIGNNNPTIENRVPINERLQKVTDKYLKTPSDIILEEAKVPNTPLDGITSNTNFDKISLQNKLEKIASKSKDKLEDVASNSDSSVDSIDHFFPKKDLSVAEATIVTNLTGYSQIERDGNTILEGIETFIKLYKTNDLPDWDKRKQIYTVLKAQLFTFSTIYSGYYSKWIKSPSIENKIDLFESLEDKLEDVYEPTEQGSDTYSDVAEATTQEQEAWSEKAKSPTLLSPVPENNEPVFSPEMTSYAIEDQQVLDYQRALTPIQETESKPSLLQQIKSKRLEYGGTPDSTPVNSSPPSPIVENIDLPNQENFEQTSYAVDNRSWLEPFMDDLEKSDAIKSKTFSSLTDIEFIEDEIEYPKPPILRETSNLASSSNVKIENLPKISIDTNSDEDRATYFPNPEVNPDDVNTGFKSMFNKIRDDLEEKSKLSPKIHQIGLSPKLNTKPSISNLMDDTAALFDDDDEPTVPENIITTNISDNENNSDKPLNSPDPIIDWNSAKVLVNQNDCTFNINFGDTWRAINKIHGSTNDNYLFSINFDQSMIPLGETEILSSYNLKDFVSGLDQHGFKTELREIIIEDFEGNNHSIYKNNKFFKK